MIHRVVSFLCALSLLLSVATLVFWVRSYYRVDVIASPSTRLHRMVLGGGGFFWESLAFQREDGNWRSPSRPIVRQAIAFDAWETAQPRLALRRWTTAPYLGRSRLAGTSWGGDFNRIAPRLDQVSFVRQETFDNTNGAAVTFRLVAWRMWIPCWLPFVVAALLPMYWLTRRPARPIGGSIPCPNCGYDLRASRERCPVCGAPVPPAAEPTGA